MARSNELNEWLDNWSEKIDGKKEDLGKGSLRIWNKLKFWERLNAPSIPLFKDIEEWHR